MFELWLPSWKTKMMVTSQRWYQDEQRGTWFSKTTWSSLFWIACFWMWFICERLQPHLLHYPYCLLSRPSPSLNSTLPSLGIIWNMNFWEAMPCWSCSPLCIQSWEQCLAHSLCSVNSCLGMTGSTTPCSHPHMTGSLWVLLVCFPSPWGCPHFPAPGLAAEKLNECAKD